MLFVFQLKLVLCSLELYFINSSSIWAQNWFNVNFLLFTKEKANLFCMLLCHVFPFASEKRVPTYLDRKVQAIYNARQVNLDWQLIMPSLVNDARGFQMMLACCFHLQSGISQRNLFALSFGVDVGTGYRYVLGNISFPYK